MARRGENIRKRKDGRWEGRFINSYDEAGKARYRSVYANNYNDCKRKLLDVKAKLNPGIMAPEAYLPSTKLCDAVHDWLESIRVSVKHSTYVKYRNAATNHILPTLGGTRLKAVTVNLVNGFLLKKSESGRLDGNGALSVSTVHTLHIVLTSALAFALGEGAVSGFKFKPTRKPDPEIFILKQSEQERLEANLLNEMNSFKFGILLCLYTGLRLGELCSLRWDDIDLDNMIISVRHTVQRIQTFDENAGNKTRLVVSDPKSKSSVRDIPIPSCIMEVIRTYFPDAHSGYILSGGKTNPLDPRTCQNRFKGCLKNAGVDDIHFHTLRHTFATNCVIVGVDVKSLSEILGHSNVSITLNKYIHSSRDMKRAQIEKLSVNRGQNLGNSDWIVE